MILLMHFQIRLIHKTFITVGTFEFVLNVVKAYYVKFEGSLTFA